LSGAVAKRRAAQRQGRWAVHSNGRLAETVEPAVARLDLLAELGLRLILALYLNLTHMGNTARPTYATHMYRELSSLRLVNRAVEKPVPRGPYRMVAKLGDT
jgi:hypothetical protein